MAEGLQVRVPAGTRPARGGDRHVAVVEGTRIFDAFNATDPPLSGTWSVGAAGVSHLDGSGITDKGADGVYQAAATAADWSTLVGMVRGQDLAAGRIPHQTFAVVKCTNRSVYPTAQNDNGSYRLARQCSSIGESMINAPRLGDWVFLAVTEQEIANLRYTNGAPLHRSMTILLNSWREFGTRIGDTGGYQLAKTESHQTYTPFGVTPPLQARGAAEGWTAYGGQYLLKFSQLPTWVWGRLRVIDPCVGRGTC